MFNIDANEKDDGSLDDAVLVCRGGSCLVKAFQNGSGVTLDADGKLQNVSVTAAPGRTLAELSATIRHTRVGSTTVGDIREAGGVVIPDAKGPINPFHCLIHGITLIQAETLFTPTVHNPNRP